MRRGPGRPDLPLQVASSLLTSRREHDTIPMVPLLTNLWCHPVRRRGRSRCWILGAKRGGSQRRSGRGFSRGVCTRELSAGRARPGRGSRVARNTVRAALDSLARDGFVRHERTARDGGEQRLWRWSRRHVLVGIAGGGRTLPSLLTPRRWRSSATRSVPAAAPTFSSISGDAAGGARESWCASSTVPGWPVCSWSSVQIRRFWKRCAMRASRTLSSTRAGYAWEATRVDFWRIGRHAAEFLLDLGHRRLGVLSGPK